MDRVSSLLLAKTRGNRTALRHVQLHGSTTALRSGSKEAMCGRHQDLAGWERLILQSSLWQSRLVPHAFNVSVFAVLCLE
jgi:hypothetical protein